MSKNKALNQVRIIGGFWRGRRLEIQDAPGLRPTGDRVRETLFNWLMPTLAGARCLDLFCGSGALGLEAVSRGAHSATLIDQSPSVIAHVKGQTQDWTDIDRVQFVVADAFEWLSHHQEVFDIVFIDPPFDIDGQLSCLQTVVSLGRVAAGGLIYIESPADQMLELADLPSGLRIERQKLFGQVGVCLVRYH